MSSIGARSYSDYNNWTPAATDNSSSHHGQTCGGKTDKTLCTGPTFRHGSQDSRNVVFFDSHAKTLKIGGQVTPAYAGGESPYVCYYTKPAAPEFWFRHDGSIMHS